MNKKDIWDWAKTIISAFIISWIFGIFAYEIGMEEDLIHLYIIIVISTIVISFYVYSQKIKRLKDVEIARIGLPTKEEIDIIDSLPEEQRIRIYKGFTIKVLNVLNEERNLSINDDDGIREIEEIISHFPQEQQDEINKKWRDVVDQDIRQLRRR